ncbi:MAG: hypothetical protein IKZ41_08455, partial [Clostridia bacterium]|nr:hypothetical protein [Clostridia bacterium]
MKSRFKIAIFYVVLFAVIILAAASLWRSIPQEKLVYSNIIELFRNERVEQFEVDEDNNLTMAVRVTLADGTEGQSVVTYRLRSLDLFIA